MARLGGAFCLVLGLVGPPAAVEAAGTFPGPGAVLLNGEALSAVSLPLGSEGEDYLIGGTIDGVLQMNRYLIGSKQFQVLNRFLLGGEIVALIPWEGRPLLRQGVVAATANPDRLVFLTVNPSSPYFVIEGQVALPEDPGSLAFLGDPAGAGMRLATSLPGVDQVAFLDQQGEVWSLAEIRDVGDDPHALVGADLDGDTVRELVVAQRGALSGTLGVFRRQPDFSYAFSTLPFAPGSPREIVALDLENDGVAELAAVVAGQSQVAIMRETGGQIGVVASIDLTLPADYLHMTPLFDGRPGLFTAQQERGLVEFFLFDGGEWTLQDSYYSGCNPVGLISGDLNGDTGRDLISMGGDAESLTVMFANSDPGFWGFPALALSGNPGSSALGDFDGDGYRDLFIAHAGNMVLSFFPGLATGGFDIQPRDIVLDFLPGMVAVLNADADANPELAVLDPFGGQIVLIDYSAGGDFLATTRSPVGLGPNFLTAADVDNDGLQDLLAITRDEEEVRILFGAGDGSFPVLGSFSSTNGADQVAPIDLNGDGKLDIAVTDGISRLWTRLNIDGRTFAGEMWLNAGSGARDLTTGDLDGDLDADLIVTNRTDESLSFFENDGSGSLVRRVGAFALASLPEAVLIRDIDQNGSMELVMNLSGGGLLGVSYGFGDWVYSDPVTFTAGPNVVGLMVEDLNADEAPDILTIDQSLLLGLTLYNLEEVAVPVGRTALDAHCEDGRLAVAIIPGNAGAWLLEIGVGPDWLPLAANGSALRGLLDFDRGRWFLSLERAELDAWGAVGPEGVTLRLTLGTAAGTESLTLAIADPCGKDADTIPAALAWSAEPWPNPFNPRVNARFILAGPSQVQAEVYDLSGRRVAVLLDAFLPAGDHALRWDGTTGERSAAAGVYLLRVRTAERSLARKIMLLK